MRCPHPGLHSAQFSWPISKAYGTYFSVEFALITCCFILLLLGISTKAEQNRLRAWHVFCNAFDKGTLMWINRCCYEMPSELDMKNLMVQLQ